MKNKLAKLLNFKFPSLPVVVFTLLFLGLAQMYGLLSLPDDAVFFSGDGGIKYLLAQQYLKEKLGPALELPMAHEDTASLWNRGLYPFGPPFVYEVEKQQIVSFPMYFPLISSPFLKAFGWRGLYVLPAISVLLIWLLITVFFLRLRLQLIPVCAGLTALIFAGPLTLYAAIFWEHAPAAFFAALPLILFLPEDQGNPGKSSKKFIFFVTGIFSGAGVFLRPEVFFCVLCALGFSLIFFGKKKLGETSLLFSGFSLSVIAFLVANQLIYGNPLGQHAEQVVAEAGFSADFFQAWAARALQLFVDFAVYNPPFIAVALCLPLLAFISSQWKKELVASFMIVLFSLVFIAAIAPNTGGKQLGPRYLVLLLPWCAVAFALLVEAGMSLPAPKKVSLWLLLGTFLALGINLNSWHGANILASDYKFRVLPALRLIQKQPQKLVVVSHQWIAQELSALVGSKDFLWPKREEDFRLLVSTLRQSGSESVLFVSYRQASASAQFGKLTKLGESGAYLVQRAVFE